ncbi:hypothetical protein Pse7367_2683 [Thalassoporum mexicanum PCC 7367]|uniref:hypothetical protein n=1 Tax=Thalassoporum mexicanum TaxID=3457544 RepID=UPI00029FDA37|nr:hypothetical protein [Pseudanabaena sp. PCC 7367]AFY70938.1 hypothetical protein Pse7367_2683 [Pseudanabaena sp. PCC 7367]
MPPSRQAVREYSYLQFPKPNLPLDQNMSNYATAPDLNVADYLVLGLATWFVREDGEVIPVKVIEPIPSSALEAILKKIPTSYEKAYATELGQVMTADGSIQMPAQVFDNEAQICQDFEERAIAATRTYKVRPEATEHIKVGETYTDFNFSLEKKRILNAARVVKDDDNVKQHSHTHKVL